MFGYEPELIDCGDARIACYDIGRGSRLCCCTVMGRTVRTGKHRSRNLRGFTE